MSDLPTKPGPYYWRESDGDAWDIIQVELSMLNDEPEVNGMCCESPLSGEYVHVSEIDGQWLPIPTADELVELHTKAKMVDEACVDAYVVTSVSGRSVSIDFTAPRAWSLAERLEGIFRCDLESSGYTCEPVTIIRKAKR